MADAPSNHQFSVDPKSKESGRSVGRHCCVVLNGTARTTMNVIALRSNVRAVRIYLPVIRARSPTRMKFLS
jgi:hypothetical protein